MNIKSKIKYKKIEWQDKKSDEIEWTANKYYELTQLKNNPHEYILYRHT